MTQVSSRFDVVILGQGLAGTTLAWSLRWVGSRVLVIDRNAPVTSSKIAAGLMTPITGQALAPAWRYDQLWSAAVQFYTRIEQVLGDQVLQRTGMVRLLANEVEAGIFARRRATGEYDPLIHVEQPRVNDEWFEVCHGGFEMKMTGRLDVPGYLQASRRFFESDGGYIEEDLDLTSDIERDGDGVRLPRLGVGAARIIFCQGIDAVANAWFRDVEFKPAKGEILTVKVPGLSESRVVHQGVWLAPLGAELFKVGSTYDWDRLDCVPTADGRDEIESKLKKFLRLPYEVLDHQAAVRPIHRNQFPVVGLHPLYPQLGYFNGLGSKGSLHAPYFAAQFVDYLQGQCEIDEDVDLIAKTKWQSLGPIATSTDLRRLSPNRKPETRRQRPLTELAQEAVRQVVQPGETAIDATAGNGHDTHFLAEQVGPGGRVIAFDIQSDAIKKTSKRLADAGLMNVELVHGDHGRMRDRIPIESNSRVAVVMMNLGYLPGGDKRITTRGESTVLAIAAGLQLIRSNGLMTIMAYTGHDGGADEAKVVDDQLSQLSKTDFSVSRIDSQPGKSAAPVLFLVTKKVAQYNT